MGEEYSIPRCCTRSALSPADWSLSTVVMRVEASSNFRRELSVCRSRGSATATAAAAVATAAAASAVAAHFLATGRHNEWSK